MWLLVLVSVVVVVVVRVGLWMLWGVLEEEDNDDDDEDDDVSVEEGDDVREGEGILLLFMVESVRDESERLDNEGKTIYDVEESDKDIYESQKIKKYFEKSINKNKNKKSDRRLFFKNGLQPSCT